MEEGQVRNFTTAPFPPHFVLSHSLTVTSLYWTDFHFSPVCSYPRCPPPRHLLCAPEQRSISSTCYWPHLHPRRDSHQAPNPVDHNTSNAIEGENEHDVSFCCHQTRPYARTSSRRSPRHRTPGTESLPLCLRGSFLIHEEGTIVLYPRVNRGA